MFSIGYRRSTPWRRHSIFLWNAALLCGTSAKFGGQIATREEDSYSHRWLYDLILSTRSKNRVVKEPMIVLDVGNFFAQNWPRIMMTQRQSKTIGKCAWTLVWRWLRYSVLALAVWMGKVSPLFSFLLMWFAYGCATYNSMLLELLMKKCYGTFYPVIHYAKGIKPDMLFSHRFHIISSMASRA